MIFATTWLQGLAWKVRSGPICMERGQTMNKIVKAVSTLALAAGLAGAAQAVTYTYVGSWHVGDGTLWTDNPPVYSAQDAAALLFGGSASDYAISTAGTSVAAIDFMAHVDGWGDPQYLTSTVAQNYSLDTGGSGYNSNPGYQSSYSAYVLDHSCFNRYSDASQSCASTEPGINYAFRISDSGTPEPGTWVLLVAGFGLTGTALRRRAVTAAA